MQLRVIIELGVSNIVLQQWYMQTIISYVIRYEIGNCWFS